MECRRLYTTTTRLSFPVLPSASRRRRHVSLSLCGGSSAVRCEYGGLSAPLQPRTPVGKLLSGVVLNGCDDFHAAAAKEIDRLSSQREDAVCRLHLSLGSPEAALHRKIAELKKKECQDEIEDVIYMLIFRRFAEMRVHLTPSLSRCIFGRRLEIWPSNDCELESIHSFEVLELVRDHLAASIGPRIDGTAMENRATAKISRLHLFKLYSASILYGYFLKSASLKYRLEWSLGSQLPLSEATSLASEYAVALGRRHVGGEAQSSATSTSQSSPQRVESLRSYVNGFDAETIHMCTKPKSKEALAVIENHCRALFGDGIDSDDLISTPFTTLKGFVLEGVAFGSFLWETERHVNRVYTLDDNYC